MPAATMAAIAAMSEPAGGLAASPRPGRSGASTRRVALNTGTLRTQCRHEPAPPCSITSGAPFPQLRHTMLPSPHGDSLRRALASSSRTAVSGAVFSGLGFDMLVVAPVEVFH